MVWKYTVIRTGAGFGSMPVDLSRCDDTPSEDRFPGSLKSILFLPEQVALPISIKVFHYFSDKELPKLHIVIFIGKFTKSLMQSAQDRPFVGSNYV